MTKIQSYELAEVAAHDLSEIYDYTALEYGNDQAIKYLASFEKMFDTLVKQPRMGKDRPEIVKGLRSLVYERHTIFYRIMKVKIRIVRVLHTSRDVLKFLKES